MRLRFAPSPTGTLHLGNARTALVNWLEARRQGGTLVLRLEDTDVERNVEGAEAEIMGDLAWLGIDWDEGPDRRGPHGPYRQSERSARYRAAVDALRAAGAAYPCFCGSGRLGPAADATEGAPTHGYPGTCRHLSAEQVSRRLETGTPAAIRLRVPDSEIRFEDGLRGSTGVQAGEVDDFVIARADGSPTYLLAVVVDDHDMQIDHVIRGQDHLSNTPRQILLYQALGWSPPRFSHLPLVLGADRSRLSKRHGAASVADMRRSGILPDALANYLALLGWAPPDGNEVLSMPELVDAFRVQDLSAANVAFDQAKLEWLNQQHLARTEPRALLRRSEPFLAAAGLGLDGRNGELRDWWQDLVQLFAPTCRRLDELPARLAGVVTLPASAVLDSAGRDVVEAFLQEALAGQLVGADQFRAAAKRTAASTGSKGRLLFQPLRLALTGEEHGPELARLVPLLDRVGGLEPPPGIPSLVERLQAALEHS
jgi:glutamyl-tRNA synthetase/nondiscriminating glutamyl-tRNA synthetase